MPRWTNETRDARKLKPHPKNTKNHPPEQIDLLARSMREFGITRPIIIDDKGTILAGHGAVLALLSEGMEKLARKIPVRVGTGLTEEQKRAYVIADNRIGELAEWDKDALHEELTGLLGKGFDFSLTGWSLDDLPSGPDAFAEVGSDLPTDHTCPKCGYRWSGAN